jgi:hypothetical protein
MKKFFFHHKKIARITATVILAVLFLMTLVWFIRNTKQLYRSGELETTYAERHNPNYSNQPPSVDSIRTWMTFDYINFIFKLPPDYLKNTLTISDPRYPNVRLDHYSKHHNVDPVVFLQSVKQAITNYSSSLPAQAGH